MQVPETENGQRLDRFLKNAFPATPFTAIQKLIRSGQVRVGGKRARADTRLQTGQILRLPPSLGQPPTAAPAQTAYTPTRAEAAALRQSLVFEDDAILVLNKPAGLSTQAGPGTTKSLDRMLAALYPQTPPKVTHRLDRDTTGLLVLAKTRAAAAALARQFAAHEVAKTYLVLLTGHLRPAGHGPTHHIRAALAKQGAITRAGRAGDTGSKTAHTSYRILQHLTVAGQPFTLVAATPHTGRSNQLRVHFAHLGHPIAGDTKYGTPQSKSAGKALHAGAVPLYLHAAQLGFTHPLHQKPVNFEAPPPASWQLPAGTATHIPRA